MEKVLFALEEKDLEMVSGGDVKEYFQKFGNGVKELNKGIFVGDEETEGFFAKREAGVKKAWKNMGSTGVRATVVANEFLVPAVGFALIGTAVAGGIHQVKKLFNK